MEMKSTAFLIFVLFCVGGVGASQVIDGVVDGSVYFYSSLPLPTNYRITWIYGQTENVTVMVEAIAGGIPQYSPHYMGRCELMANGTLRLDNITTSDFSWFTLTVLDLDNFTRETASYKLRIHSHINNLIMSRSNTKEAWAGEDSVVLHCYAYVSPVTFSWTKNGQPLPQDPRYYVTDFESHTVLTISPVTKNDQGRFGCTASNLANNVSFIGMDLGLAWDPEGDTACSVESVGPDVQFSCSWLDGEPASNVTMWFNGTKVMDYNIVTWTASPHDTILSSNFTCLGVHLRKSSSCTFYFEPPQSPEQNNSSVLEAKAGKTAVLTLNLIPGLPAVFTWSRVSPSHYPISNSQRTTVVSTSLNSSLRISDLTTSDSGEYECKARNSLGNQIFMFTLNVAERDGLNGGEIAGIVCGILAGVVITGITITLILKEKKRIRNENIYDDAYFRQSHNYSIPKDGEYSITFPRAVLQTSSSTREDTNYEVINPENALQSNPEPAHRK